MTCLAMDVASTVPRPGLKPNCDPTEHDPTKYISIQYTGIEKSKIAVELPGLCL